MTGPAAVLLAFGLGFGGTVDAPPASDAVAVCAECRASDTPADLRDGSGVISPAGHIITARHVAPSAIERGARTVQVRLRLSSARLPDIGRALSARDAHLHWTDRPMSTVRTTD